MGFKIRFGVMKYYTEETGITAARVPEGVKRIGRKEKKRNGFSELLKSIPDSLPEHLNILLLAHLPCRRSRKGSRIPFLSPEDHKDNAFIHCVHLRSIYLPDSVQEICRGAFSKCYALKTVRFPRKLTVIPESAFYRCESLETITIPPSVTEIQTAAFMDCTALKEIILPPGLNTLPKAMFSGCSALQTVSLPDSISCIQYAAFWGCSSLQCIQVSENHPLYRTEDGVLYTKDGKTLVRCPPGKSSLLIPDGVQHIQTEAFSSCRNLTTLCIPDSVQEISSYTFAKCTELKSIRLPKTLQTLAAAVFKGCKSLRRIVLPASVRTVGRDAFCDCESLTAVTLPDHLEAIGKNAFAGCSALQEIGLTSGGKADIDISVYDLSVRSTDGRKLEKELEAMFLWMHTGKDSGDFQTVDARLKYAFVLLKYRRDHDSASAKILETHSDALIRSGIQYGDAEQVAVTLRLSKRVILPYWLDIYLRLAMENGQNAVCAVLAAYKNEHYGFADTPAEDDLL